MPSKFKAQKRIRIRPILVPTQTQDYDSLSGEYVANPNLADVDENYSDPGSDSTDTLEWTIREWNATEDEDDEASPVRKAPRLRFGDSDSEEDESGEGDRDSPEDDEDDAAAQNSEHDDPDATLADQVEKKVGRT